MSSPNHFVSSYVFCLLGFLGCAGPEEGVYTGKIGNKKEVTIRIKTDGLVNLKGIGSNHSKAAMTGDL